MKAVMIRDDWQELLNFLPHDWLDLAREHGALKGLRKDKSADSLLRTMMLHCACGYSLRETSVRAEAAGLADMSGVALMKRLKKCGAWFRAMSLALLHERMASFSNNGGLRLRVFDATHVKEPGQTGSQWRIHYSMILPELECDFFKLSSTKGKGCGESFRQFPVEKGDYILADRGYCKGNGLEYLTEKGAFVTVRLQPGAVVLTDKNHDSFDLIEALKGLSDVGQIGEWEVCIGSRDGAAIPGRICAMLKSEDSAALSRKKSLHKASKKCHSIRDSTLFYSNYIIVFSTFGQEHTAEDIMHYYRLRWQIELVFKRFKQIAGLGHVPKHDDESSRSWLYGKLFVALLAEKLIAYGSAISPWRVYHNQDRTNKKSLAGIYFYVSPSDGSYFSLPRFTGNAFKLV